MSFGDYDEDRDQIYIAGLPEDVTEEQLAEHFGVIGMIKMDKSKRPPAPKIWLYRDKATGKLKGDATVTYDDPFAANSAPSWFDGKEFRGKVIKVSLAEKPKKVQELASRDRGGYGGGGGRGYGGGGGGG
ncbi:hypothetical protein H632_c2210p0, partial [Helicosporidium sp. ATCC 50920]